MGVMIKGQTDAELAYVAAMLDGEGSISSHKNKPSPTYTVQVRIGNGNPKLMEWLQDKFGGNVQSGNMKGAKAFYTWYVPQANVYEFLNAIIRFMVLKTRQAKLAMILASLQDERGRLKGYELTEEMENRERFIAEQITMMNNT